MADVNAPVEQAPAVAPPTRTDEQILPRIRWVPIGKSNCYLDAEKSQSNPIYKIAVDILKQTNFFRAFTASSTIPAIYIQQFWDTICYDRTRRGLQVSMTFGFESQEAPVLQFLWGIINQSSYRFCWKDVGKNSSIYHYILSRKDKKYLAQTYSGKEESQSHCDLSCEGNTKEGLWGLHIPNELFTVNSEEQTNTLYYLEKEPCIKDILLVKEVHLKQQPRNLNQQHPSIGTKQAKETTEATPPAKRAKAGKVVKKRTLKRSQQLVDEFVDEESLKDAHGAPRGPLPPVVFRETDTGKFQPFPEVEGKGKEKVDAEQAAQRCTSAPIEPSGHDESLSLYVKLGLTESDTKSDEEMPPIVKSGDQDEGQARPDPDAEATDATSQPQPRQMDEVLTTLHTYPKRTSALAVQLFNDKPPEADNKKTTADTEAKSMVSITIHQDTSAIPPMTSPVIDLVSRPDSPNVHRPLPTIATATATTTTTTITTLILPPQPQ
ncbi:hypothetical protein Tco_0593491 [Tanacetum coccineum]